jgi:hypothetical protein
MALPFRWSDQFFDRGWVRVLTPAALRLVQAVGRRVDKDLRTRTKLGRLQKEAGLPRSTFFRAQSELKQYGLFERKKIDGKWHLVLAVPVPYPPERSLTSETKRSHQRDFLVSSMGPAKHQTPSPVRLSANGQQKTGRQLGGKSSIALQQWLVRKLGLAPRQGILEDILGAASVVQGAPTQLVDEARALSRLLQSKGVLIPEVEVRTLLSDAVALLDPVVESAVRLFNGQIAKVREAAP